MSSYKVWDKAYKYLLSKGFDVYPPATKRGECKSDYIVLKSEATSQLSTFSSEVQYYLILCYSNKYTSLLKLVDNVKSVMNRYYPNMKPTGNETVPFYDDDVKAYMVSIQYRTVARNNRL